MRRGLRSYTDCHLKAKPKGITIALIAQVIALRLVLFELLIRQFNNFTKDS